jgi:hypothetical protein
MPDRVHAAAEAMEPPGAEPVLDPLRTEPELRELVVRYDTVLAKRERCDLRITWSLWYPLIEG